MIGSQAKNCTIFNLSPTLSITIWNKRLSEIPSGCVYCGRPTLFGNPFQIGQDGDRTQVCNRHEYWLDTGKSFGNVFATEERRQRVLAALPLLKDKDLVCWCAPNRCHCEYLARRANQV